MNIIFSSDNYYAPYLAISIFSIIKNTPEKINFYILDMKINQENKTIINNLASSYSCKVFFLPVCEADFQNFPKTIDYISLATYARLNLTKYIKNIEKAIYIDVDTLTNSSLQELWDIDITNYYLAACRDTFIDVKNEAYKKSIGLEGYSYFNAGILLINLNKWKEENIFQKSINWMNKYNNVMKYQDQDILNGICKGKVKFINNRFNFTPTDRGLIKNKNLLHVKMPIIISHYCGPYKFWHKKCGHLNCHIGNLLLKEMDKIIDIPSSWYDHFEKIPFLIKIKRLRKRIKDKLIYGIY
ncbi:TPA: glycosyltransferase family 8 protein [Haemophilus influenzae]